MPRPAPTRSCSSTSPATNGGGTSNIARATRRRASERRTSFTCPSACRSRSSFKSNDVIHSFWVPNLAGKQDLIPGRVTDIQLVPRKIGLFRGQCAEFCGVQHAHMALDVTVESRADFDKWVAAQQRVAFAPQNPVEQAGLPVLRHARLQRVPRVGGSPAAAAVGPDLTHFASRRSIAAGTLPMSEANLQAWMADPQKQKPGNNMPKIGLAPDERPSLAALPGAAQMTPPAKRKAEPRSPRDGPKLSGVELDDAAGGNMGARRPASSAGCRASITRKSAGATSSPRWPSLRWPARSRSPCGCSLSRPDNDLISAAALQRDLHACTERR